ncbi:DUF2625 family protein [Streptomyces sp. NPDC058371]|uniref:DUF2625 family protein n=1 Tax=Streptomyces sp. NPDC058371 TaxID=3346463 RepID=UPI00366281C8
MRDLTELIDVEEPAWPLVSAELATGEVHVDLLPVDPERGRRALLQLQITARSWLGGIVLNCGGLVLDSGWLRVYGSPGDDGPGGLPGVVALPSLAEVNGFPGHFDPAWRPRDALVVAHDVLGGVFTVNGPDPQAAGRPGEPGEVVYFAPDSLRWDALGTGYGPWLAWLLTGGMDQFYETLRWPGWRAETGALSGTQGLSFVPFLWSADARRDLAATSRRAVPLAELLGVNRDFCQELDSVDPGFLGDI